MNDKLLLSEIHVEDEVQAPRIKLQRLQIRFIDPKINFTEQESTKTAFDNFLGSVREYLSPHDMKRLEAYVDNLADFHLIVDLVSILTHLYFKKRFQLNCHMFKLLCYSALVCKIRTFRTFSVLCLPLVVLIEKLLESHSLMCRFIEEGQLKWERQQILSEFIKIMKKFYKYLYGLESKEIESTLPQLKEIVMEPHSVSVEEDLNNAAKQVEDYMKSKAEAPFTRELLQWYAIEDGGFDFETILQNNGGKIPTGGLISVKSSRNGVKLEKVNESHERDKKRRKDDHNHKLSKRRS